MARAKMGGAMTEVLTCISNVRPSGAARDTAWLPMAPDTPGRFSTTGWPSAACYSGAASRVLPGVRAQ